MGYPQYDGQGSWQSGWDKPSHDFGHVRGNVPPPPPQHWDQGGYAGSAQQGYQERDSGYGANFVAPNESGIRVPPAGAPPGGHSVKTGITPRSAPRTSVPCVVPKPSPPPITVPQAPTTSNGAPQQPSCDYAPLQKAVKFFVASQLSKFFTQSRYLDSNQNEFLNCANHLIEKIMEVEKAKGSDTYKTRRMQESVLTFVNAYMEKYMLKKEKMLREMGKSKRPEARGQRKKRKRYGRVELHGDPAVQPMDDSSEEDDDADDVVMLKHETGVRELFTTSNSLISPKKDEAVENTPTPTKQGGTQTQHDPIPFSSQPSRSRSGVKVDYGYDEQEVDGFTESSMSDNEPIAVEDPSKAERA